MKFIRKMFAGRRDDTLPIDDFETAIGQADDLYFQDDFDAVSLEEPDVPREQPAPAVARSVPVARATPESEGDAAQDMLDRLSAALQADPPKPALNIWDIEEEEDIAEAEAIAASRPASRPRRRRAYLAEDEGGEAAQGDDWELPLGWLVMVSGPARGEAIALEDTLVTIGGGPDQMIRLDGVDSSIGTGAEAIVTYDPDSRAFCLTPGTHDAVLRLNGRPLRAETPLERDDIIGIGRCRMVFAPLCGQGFDWSDAEGRDDHAQVA